MLPQRHRLRRSADFAMVLRSGRRAARDTVVVHVGTAGDDLRVTRFGLVVGRGVGNSVTRHRVSRRLRAVLASRVDQFPVGADVVVRARPAAADAASRQLSADVDGALAVLLARTRPAKPVGAIR